MSTETRILSDDQFLVQALREVHALSQAQQRLLIADGGQNSELYRCALQIELRASYLLKNSCALTPSELDTLRDRLQSLQRFLGLRPPAALPV